MQKEKFKQLYDFCQTLTPYISRSEIQNKLLTIFPDSPFVVMFDHGMNPDSIKGYFVASNNNDHPFVKNGLRNTIVLAKGLNQCWERFVTVKEMMHLFDDENELTDSADKFSDLLNDLEGSTPNEGWSAPMRAETRCVWMTLACLCPEKYRKSFETARLSNSMDDYEIAVQLKVPAQHVPKLFREDFPKIVGNLFI